MSESDGTKDFQRLTDSFFCEMNFTILILGKVERSFQTQGFCLKFFQNSIFSDDSVMLSSNQLNLKQNPSYPCFILYDQYNTAIRGVV